MTASAKNGWLAPPVAFRGGGAMRCALLDGLRVLPFSLYVYARLDWIGMFSPICIERRFTTYSHGPDPGATTARRNDPDRKAADPTVPARSRATFVLRNLPASSVRNS